MAPPSPPHPADAAPATSTPPGRLPPPHEQPTTPLTPTGGDVTTSWVPVDATPYLDGTYQPPEPSHLLRTDGLGLFYPGRINLLFGESEVGKGWVALAAVAQALAAGDAVLYLDLED